MVGHHGIYIRSSHNLMHDIVFEEQFRHDFSIGGSGTADWNVLSGFRGADMNIDHHSKEPRRNLFTDFDLGKGTRPHESNGRNSHEPYPNGKFDETFWNLRADRDMPLPNGTGSLVVGMRTGAASQTSGRIHHERIDPDALAPQNIYLAQQRLLGGWVPPTRGGEPPSEEPPAPGGGGDTSPDPSKRYVIQNKDSGLNIRNEGLRGRPPNGRGALQRERAVRAVAVRPRR